MPTGPAILDRSEGADPDRLERRRRRDRAPEERDRAPEEVESRLQRRKDPLDVPVVERPHGPVRLAEQVGKEGQDGRVRRVGRAS